jgi:hypothetical protein
VPLTSSLVYYPGSPRIILSLDYIIPGLYYPWIILSLDYIILGRCASHNILSPSTSWKMMAGESTYYSVVDYVLTRDIWMGGRTEAAASGRGGRVRGARARAVRILQCKVAKGHWPFVGVKS